MSGTLLRNARCEHSSAHGVGALHQVTYLEQSGNDFDQCALLSALLQASGYSPGYQFGYLQMPYDNPTNHQDIHHCLS